MASQTIFFTDFNEGVPSEFSKVTKTEKVKGYKGIGPSGNQFSGNFLINKKGGNPAAKTVLTLTNLPEHTSISLKFLWAGIDSWDGLYAPNEPSGVPDFFNVTVNGKSVFSEAFDNVNTFDTGYSSPNHPVDQSYQPSSDIFLGDGKWKGRRNFSDSAYNLGRDSRFNKIKHTDDTLTIKWFASGSGWDGGKDESWAIDNVKVVLNNKKKKTANLDSLTGKSGVFNSDRDSEIWNLGTPSQKESISLPVLDREASLLRTLNNVEKTMMPKESENLLLIDNPPFPIHDSSIVI